jgi:hypothetical protein
VSALAGILNIIPGWLWAVITAGAIATSCTQSIRLDLATSKHATYKADVERLRAEAIEKARQTEKELQDAADQAQKEADALRVERDAAAARAAAAAQRLRNAISSTGACEAARTADERKAADQAAAVRAELLGRLDEMAGEISRFADDAHQAGLTCQNLYERARTKR